YSLGCALYHLLTGQVPFPGGTVRDKLRRHATAAPEPLTLRRADVPPPLARVIDRMMARKPEDRYQTPADVAAALAPFTRARRRGRWLVAPLAAALLLGGGVVAFVSSRPRPETAPPENAGPAEIEVVRRIPWAGAPLFYDTHVSKGGK